MDTGVIDSSSISDLVFDYINSSRESDTTSGKPWPSARETTKW